SSCAAGRSRAGRHSRNHSPGEALAEVGTMRMMFRSWGRVAVLAALAGALAGCNHAPPAKTTRNPKVVVSQPVTETVMDYQDFTGRLEAGKRLEIPTHARVY